MTCYICWRRFQEDDIVIRGNVCNAIELLEEHWMHLRCAISRSKGEV